MGYATFVEFASSESSVNLSVLGQYGILGVFSVLLIVFARTSYKRETDRSDRLEAEVLRLNTLLQEKAIPALASATNALEESQALVRDLQQERYRTELALRQRIREIENATGQDPGQA